MQSKSKIVLIYTGGTIGMSKDFETGALIAFDFGQLLQQVSELKLLDCAIRTISYDESIDSSNMNPENWGILASIIETITPNLMDLLCFMCQIPWYIRHLH